MSITYGRTLSSYLFQDQAFAWENHTSIYWSSAQHIKEALQLKDVIAKGDLHKDKSYSSSLRVSPPRLKKKDEEERSSWYLLVDVSAFFYYTRRVSSTFISLPTILKVSSTCFGNSRENHRKTKCFRNTWTARSSKSSTDQIESFKRGAYRLEQTTNQLEDRLRHSELPLIVWRKILRSHLYIGVAHAARRDTYHSQHMIAWYTDTVVSKLSNKLWLITIYCEYWRTEKENNTEDNWRATKASILTKPEWLTRRLNRINWPIVSTTPRRYFNDNSGNPKDDYRRYRFDAIGDNTTDGVSLTRNFTGHTSTQLLP